MPNTEQPLHPPSSAPNIPDIVITVDAKHSATSSVTENSSLPSTAPATQAASTTVISEKKMVLSPLVQKGSFTTTADVLWNTKILPFLDIDDIGQMLFTSKNGHRLIENYLQEPAQLQLLRAMMLNLDRIKTIQGIIVEFNRAIDERYVTLHDQELLPKIKSGLWNTLKIVSSFAVSTVTGIALLVKGTYQKEMKAQGEQTINDSFDRFLKSCSKSIPEGAYSIGGSIYEIKDCYPGRFDFYRPCGSVNFRYGCNTTVCTDFHNINCNTDVPLDGTSYDLGGGIALAVGVIAGACITVCCYSPWDGIRREKIFSDQFSKLPDSPMIAKHTASALNLGKEDFSKATAREVFQQLKTEFDNRTKRFVDSPKTKQLLTFLDAKRHPVPSIVIKVAEPETAEKSNASPLPRPHQ